MDILNVYIYIYIYVMRFCFFRNTLQRYFENHKKKKHTFHLVYKDAFHIHQNYVHTFTYRFSWKANCKKVYNNKSWHCARCWEEIYCILNSEISTKYQVWGRKSTKFSRSDILRPNRHFWIWIVTHATFSLGQITVAFLTECDACRHWFVSHMICSCISQQYNYDYKGLNCE